MFKQMQKSLPIIWLLLLVAACSPSAGYNGGTTVEDLDFTGEPPPASLTIDGQTQPAGIGSSCWDPGGGTALCTDMIGIPTESEPLQAGSTFLAEFELPLQTEPDEVSLSLFRVAVDEALPGNQGGWSWWPHQIGEHYGLPPNAHPLIEMTQKPGVYVLVLSASWPEYGDASYGFLVSVSDALSQDAAAFAADMGLTQEQAGRRLGYQDSIGEVQALLMTELAATFAGLWVEHEPAYQIVIALTAGDEGAIQPFIEENEWAEFAQVRTAKFTLARLSADQAIAGQAARKINVPVSTAVDVKNNRVELMVGNPALFQADLAEAGLVLPGSVVVLATNPGGDLPDSNRGVLLQATTATGQTITLPKQAPSGAAMAALIEGTLLEINGCLRIFEQNDATGFMVIWPNEADLRVGEEMIEVLDEEGQVIARVGERIRFGGGAMESPTAAARLQESIPGLPVQTCPGPYWIAGQIETLAEQQIPDIYFEPYSSSGQILAWYVNQSRPSSESELLLGELQIDEAGCMRVDGYLVIWPPAVYLREEPLRIVDEGIQDIAQIGDTIQLTGAEKIAADYRYFDNKVGCIGPYWGVNTVTALP